MGRKGDNRSDSARARTRQYKADPGTKPSPVPLESCPWCATQFTADSFALWPNDDRPQELRITCTSLDCDFSGDRPLPVLAVDEPIYRRLPAFLIATVDKFASLPWEARTGMLLGGADRHDTSGFHGAAGPRAGKLLDRPLLPPDLVIQDELHLISGPLGTMVGLYESVIDALCRCAAGDGSARPKIVASTATARQAREQIRALFARSDTQVFPPPGPDRRDSFFARTMPVDRVAGPTLSGHCVSGTQPQGAHAAGLACAHGGCRTGVPGCRRAHEP